jgi:hypothetical protein
LHGRENAINTILPSVTNWKKTGTAEVILMTGESGNEFCSLLRIIVLMWKGMGKTVLQNRLCDIAKVRGFDGSGILECEVLFFLIF